MAYRRRRRFSFRRPTFRRSFRSFRGRRGSAGRRRRSSRPSRMRSHARRGAGPIGYRM